MAISEWDGALRVLLAVALCGVLGLERELRRKDAGLRTFTLVGTGAALFTVVGPALAHPGSNVEPTRIAAQVATGIGFLGAGLILRQGTRVRNLTTAAEVWTTAAVGVAAGVGLYLIAVVTTAAILVVVRFFGPVERRIARPHGVLVDTEDDADAPQGKGEE